MTALRGLGLVGGEPAQAGPRTFRAIEAATGAALAPPFHAATPADVERACRLAHQAFAEFGRSDAERRAGFLRAIAAAVEASGDELVTRAGLESALPEPRLRGELARTCHQLRLFAQIAAEGSWVDARIDTADPERKPQPRPDVRSVRRPLGPVAVFGASNFPLAFSVAGGDTASALAAGNPVIVKAHPAHPGTSELAGTAIARAAQETGTPAGVFSLLFDDGFDVAEALVRHPLVRAVGFTGSRAGGEALMRLAAARPTPIPVYAEMGSVNPVVILPGALATRGREIATAAFASITLGVGQFCTNPGVVAVPAGDAGDDFVARLADETRASTLGAMLTAGICHAYERGRERLRELGAQLVAEGPPPPTSRHGRPTVWEVAAARAAQAPGLLAEVFGPSTLVVRYAGREELEALLLSLEGQLTGTLHATAEDLDEHPGLVGLLESRVGRVVFDQFPTGVEVNDAMVHGGPFPATSDGRSTSVGARAIERFTRLVAYQNCPAAALPEELRDENPRGLWRRIDGTRSVSRVGPGETEPPSTKRRSAAK